ncbi:hypothetical protein WISP_01067 [Willisornis vidua]|uniref:Choline/carnitine acyltransferase domain-containing protein n=1 Tax=Willisornis vidua TaxID=1566151 RepID=A0ABQ9E0H0_9PASS|nr:hypothetical protein WISP_01067 [Willisornis vidua]
MFRLGRTDTIRSTSVDSLNFVQSMDSPDESVRNVEREDSTPKNNSCLFGYPCVSWCQLSRTAPVTKLS